MRDITAQTIETHAAMKKEHPDTLLLFRMGDYYEMFRNDAKTAAGILGLVVTRTGDGVDMSGFAHHQLDGYLAKLVFAGLRVAVCEPVVA